MVSDRGREQWRGSPVQVFHCGTPERESGTALRLRSSMRMRILALWCHRITTFSQMALMIGIQNHWKPPPTEVPLR